jgi:acrylyl-CoA reductase (NADPH)
VAVEILAKLGYHVVAITGKGEEANYLRSIGAKEVVLRQSLDLTKIRPLDRATFAGAIDNLGGDILSWLVSTQKVHGMVAAVGLAASHKLNTTVMPFILRGVRLLGINSGGSSNDIRDLVWRRLATDMKPPLLKDMARTIAFRELPGVFDDFIEARVSRRVVVDLSD